MATVGFIKFRYGDTPEQLIDTMNKNFAKIEYILANGKLNGTNLDVDYLNSLEVDVARITGELIVGENVSIGETLGPIETAIEEKKRVFTNTPTPPYDIGDIWLPSSGNTGVMKVCQIAKTTLQAYSASDWRECLSYTEPTGVTTIIDGTVTTDFVNALNIVAGSVSADNISGGTISGVTINVSTDMKIGNKLILKDTNFLSGIQWGTNLTRPEIFIDPMSRAMTIKAVEGGIYFMGDVHGVVAEFA